MLTKALILVVALYAQSVHSSHYHGPTAVPVVLHNGYLADTHEVAAAKSAHLATLSHQSHGGSYHADTHYTQHAHHADLRYHGPIAIPHVLHDGHIADSHEVAAAKAEHYAAVAKARAPIAIPHVLHDGHIADTHEVAAAKAEHYAAVAKARAHGAYHHGGDYSSQYASGYNHYSGASGAHQGYGTHSSYHGPIAITYVLHDGHIADTHEVAAAKAEHYAAVAKARAHGGYHHGGDYSIQYASGYNHYSGASGAHQGYGTHSSYHGPLAKPVVLPSGYLADTHVVAHSKQIHLQALHDARHNSDNSHIHH